MDKLIYLVEKWSMEKGLHEGNVDKQALKMVEETGETVSCLIRDDLEGVMDGIGDVIVTLVVLAQQLDLDVTECLEVAYNEIKDRKGMIIDGTFIKEEDYEKNK